MRLNRLMPPKQTSKQRGSALVVAVFVIVVLGLLVATLSRLTVTSSDSVVTEVLGTRAYNAAQTGLNRALMFMFPLNSSNRACSDPNFPASYNDFNATDEPGLAQCEVAIGCEQATYQGKQYFELSAIGECQAGSQRTSRQLSIEVTGL